MMNTIYAHSLEGKPLGEWQSLRDHAVNACGLAAAFAQSFQSSSWLTAAAALHDAGKARNAFQAYLRKNNGSQDQEYDSAEHRHSGPSAVWAMNEFGNAGLILAYLIAGHHAGLPDYIGGVRPNGSLLKRLETDKPVAMEEAVCSWVGQNRGLWKGLKLTPPWKFSEPAEAHFWLRMMFSCLVDADCLDSEEFSRPEQTRLRKNMPQLDSLAESFFRQLDEKQVSADKTPLNAVRAEIRSACEQAAALSPGMFSLTVPTGGGKTLSSTAFAFRHAVMHQQRRIIYVIPYTSIIEQTAEVLRGFLGAENVLEHHSGSDNEKETPQARLAADNWDAPVIVTTNVQFFESFYACRGSTCRKLHNIAESVIILDEVQLLPPELLSPCVEVLRQLVRSYRCTIVLSTATQPGLPGLDAVREIMPNVPSLFQRLQRTDVNFPEPGAPERTWDDLARELCTHEQVLCIVNTRRDCRELHELMPEETYHLSASMCPAHRLPLINQIKQQLADGTRPLRVIATQLIEAGVDIDFPVVYRSFTGLSSIAQAAGRCNREGKMLQHGQVHVFMAPRQAPPGTLRKAEQVMRQMLLANQDLRKPESCTEFFKLFYSSINSRGEQFRAWLEENASRFQFQFREAAQAFHMIDESNSKSVLVRYADNADMIEELERNGPSRSLGRNLQRYRVSVPQSIARHMLQCGLLHELPSGELVQTLPSLYSGKTGLDIFQQKLDPRDLMY